MLDLRRTPYGERALLTFFSDGNCESLIDHVFESAKDISITGAPPIIFIESAMIYLERVVDYSRDLEGG